MVCVEGAWAWEVEDGNGTMYGSMATMWWESLWEGMMECLTVTLRYARDYL